MRDLPIFKYAAWLSFFIVIFSCLIWTGFIRIPASPFEINTATNKIEFNISDFATYVSSIFSTLTLIWLVVNAWQQREDLALQREEMRRNNIHQEEQAEQLKETAKIGSENLKMQKEIYFRELINIKIKALTGAILAASQRYQIVYHVKSTSHDDGFGNLSAAMLVIMFRFTREFGNDYYLEDLIYVSNILKSDLDEYKRYAITGTIVKLEVRDQDTLDLAYIQQIAKIIKEKLNESMNEVSGEHYFPEFLFFYDFFDRLNFFFELYIKALNQHKKEI